MYLEHKQARLMFQTKATACAHHEDRCYKSSLICISPAAAAATHATTAVALRLSPIAACAGVQTEARDPGKSIWRLSPQRFRNIARQNFPEGQQAVAPFPSYCPERDQTATRTAIPACVCSRGIDVFPTFRDRCAGSLQPSCADSSNNGILRVKEENIAGKD